MGRVPAHERLRLLRDCSQTGGCLDRVIRVRAALAVVRDGSILLVPHYNTDAGPVQWLVPGGRVDFGESVRDAASREFTEETGLRATVGALLDVSEVLLPDRPWHSLTVTYSGTIVGGRLAAEPEHGHGEKIPRWLSSEDLIEVPYHPKRAVELALGLNIAAPRA